ncbi:MAG: DUF3999 family protein [Gammaproteobacteria bacterium]|nr:MAG: DUF3999 family protein [Gammaproteobacteria bacterium]
MNKHNIFIVALLFFLATSRAFSAQYSPPLYQVEKAQGTYIQVSLTYDIYSYSKSDDLRDLVVLDADQNALPHRFISVIPNGQKSENKISTDTLNFFPVAIDAAPETLRNLHTRQTSVQDGKVQTITRDSTLDNKTPEFYVIDISKLDHDIDSLSIDWDVNAENQYLEVELEATRNLKDWVSLGHATLMQVTHQDQVLKHNHIVAKIYRNDFEFLRLKILRGAEKLNISNISAEQITGTTAEKKRPLEAWSVSGKVAKDQSSIYFPNSRTKAYPVAAWEFSRNESTPAATVGIDLGKNIYGDSAKIFSRSNEDQNWNLQYQGILFNVLVGDQWQKSDAISINDNHDKFWRLELSPSAANYSVPTLVFAWEPIQLQIIASNKPPFVLVMSNNKSDNGNSEQIFSHILGENSPEWAEANLTRLDNTPESLVQAATPTDWKKWLFWIALLLAVAVLLLFSVRLFKQLKASDAGP